MFDIFYMMNAKTSFFAFAADVRFKLRLMSVGLKYAISERRRRDAKIITIRRAKNGRTLCVEKADESA